MNGGRRVSGLAAGKPAGGSEMRGGRAGRVAGTREAGGARGRRGKEKEDEMDQIAIKAEERTELGTGAVRRLRRTGLIPGAVNRMKGGTLPVKLSAHDFMLAMRGRTSKQLLVSLEVNGSTIPALMREVQNDVIGGTPIHVDFGEVSLTEKVRVTVPVVLTGEPVGVKIGGGILEQVLRKVDVDCLPGDIVEKFTVDVSSMNLSDTLFVRDLKLGGAYTVATRGEVPVAVIKAPDGEAEAAAGAAAPEVINKGKKEEAPAPAGEKK